MERDGVLGLDFRRIVWIYRSVRGKLPGGMEGQVAGDAFGKIKFISPGGIPVPALQKIAGFACGRHFGQRRAGLYQLLLQNTSAVGVEPDNAKFILSLAGLAPFKLKFF